MPNPSWREDYSVIQRLVDSPREFPLIQAIRLLERSAAYLQSGQTAMGASLGKTHSIGRFSPPTQECIRFKNSQSLSFPSTEIVKLTPIEQNTENGQWEVFTSFMGLTGAHGVMPYSFTEMLLKRLKLKDKSLADFFDLFNHRTISLFYQASIKYSLPLGYERKRLLAKSSFSHSNDTGTEALFSLIGLATKGLQEQLSIKPEGLLFYSGLLSLQVKTASGLKQILSSYFDVPIKINEFLGRWEEVIDDIRSRLPDSKNPKGQNVCLGRSTMLGKRGWVAQGKIQIVIGPLTGEQFKQFAPGGSALKALNDIVRFYVGFESEYDFKILVNRKDTPERVVLNAENKPIMGWNTMLSGGLGNSSKAGKTISISVSASS